MSTPQIEAYRFGQLVVDGQPYTRDVIILPDQVVDGWWRRKGHELHPQDLNKVLEAASEIEVLVVGQGADSQVRILPETRQALDKAGIELMAQSTPAAWQTYNRLRDSRPVAAALHLTC